MNLYLHISRRWIFSLGTGALFAAAFVACSGDTGSGGGTTGSSSSSGGGGMMGVGGASQSGGGMPGTGGNSGTGGMMQGMGGMMGMGPKPCQSDPDCVNACPPGSSGCACDSTPIGMICVPTCQMNSDCPMGPMGMQLICVGGTCAPGMMGGGGAGGMGQMGPVTCQMNSDCFGACTPGSLGCECASLPMGMYCTSTCTVDAHCPPGPMGSALTCQNGFCLP